MTSMADSVVVERMSEWAAMAEVREFGVAKQLKLTRGKKGETTRVRRKEGDWLASCDTSIELLARARVFFN